MRVTPIIKLIVTAYFSPQLHGTGSYDPELPKKSSHSLVVDLTPDDKDEYRVATALVRLITKADTYPGII